MKDLKQWIARSPEEQLLESYWKEKRGCILAEVPIGGPGGPERWSATCERRRIDGVRIKSKSLPEGIYKYNAGKHFLSKAIDEMALIELIEVKQKLNRLVIGQILAAQDMFERQYHVRSRRITIVCGRTDGGLKWVCSKRGIIVHTITT